jgi:hypothetical protein
MKWTCAKIDELVSDETLLDVLMDKGLLAKDPACSKCEKTMTLRKRSTCKDGYEVSLFFEFIIHLCFSVALPEIQEERMLNPVGSYGLVVCALEALSRRDRQNRNHVGE